MNGEIIDWNNCHTSEQLESISAHKNDLGVDDEERKLALMYLEQMKEDYIEGVGYERHPLPEYYAIETAIKLLSISPATPQLSSGLEKNSKKLEKDFGELDCISREQALRKLKESAEHHANDSREEVLLRRDRDIIRALPPVTPIRPKGHWIKVGDRGFGYSDIVICKCSECEYQTEFVGKFDGHDLVIDTERADNYCSNCGSDNR
jgi:hypothetical protein